MARSRYTQQTLNNRALNAHRAQYLLVGLMPDKWNCWRFVGNGKPGMHSHAGAWERGKVKQKVSGCFRSEQYAQAYCRISSYLQTMANKGYNPLTAIQLALAGKAFEVGGE